jgi:hypothetical protein
LLDYSELMGTLPLGKQILDKFEPPQSMAEPSFDWKGKEHGARQLPF